MSKNSTSTAKINHKLFIHTNYLLWVIVGLGVTALFVAALYLREKHIRKIDKNMNEDNNNMKE